MMGYLPSNCASRGNVELRKTSVSQIEDTLQTHGFRRLRRVARIPKWPEYVSKGCPLPFSCFGLSGTTFGNIVVKSDPVKLLQLPLFVYRPILALFDDDI